MNSNQKLHRVVNNLQRISTIHSMTDPHLRRIFGIKTGEEGQGEGQGDGRNSDEKRDTRTLLLVTIKRHCHDHG